jgi:tRNA A-37 threonylcarbamoyl transferase component Bud32/tetratricopeptide (TPR) repeat protein
MNSEVRDLFHELADLDLAGRERVFAERRVAPELRAEVESLLAFDATKGESLDDYVPEAVEAVLDSSGGRGPGQCGPYRLLRQLGSGGMGAVYLAERTDGELQQKVAVKLLPAGGYPEAWRARFLKERQYLSCLNHAAIVRVLDAGHTADGRPYLVMEYVAGRPIDLCAPGLDVRDRLKLFLGVCDAVSHAHRQLIVHRDLKPSNILVDDQGKPKLLDFGIAKLLDESAEATATIDRLLTPSYASPEQLSGASQNTMTDVYSLGAVLYKLLTGRSPHESGAGAAQIHEIVAGTWHIPPPSRLNRDLPADLDFIVRKALRTRPEDRYVSVDALAADVRAVLTWRPVEARAGDVWYRARRFGRRHWLPVAATGVALSGLFFGLYESNNRRAVAQRRFTEVRHLANQVLTLESSVRDLPGSAKVRHEIVAMSKEYLEKLGAEARGDRDLAVEIAEAYAMLAVAQGVPVTSNLGQTAAAQESLLKAESLLADVLTSSPQNRAALHTGTEVAMYRMVMAQTDQRDFESLQYAQQAVDRQEAFLRLGNISDSERKRAIDIFFNVSLGYKNCHRFGDAIRIARRSVELALAAPATQNFATLGMSIIADSRRFSGDLDGALSAMLEARHYLEAGPGKEVAWRREMWISALWREGMILGEVGGINLNRPEDAVKSLDEAFAMAEEGARRDPNDAKFRILLASAARELGPMLRHRNPQRALSIYQQAAGRLDEVPVSSKTRREKSRLLAGSAYVLRDLHRAGEAQQQIDAAFALLRQTKDYPAGQIQPGEDADVVLRAQADHYAETDRPVRAAEVYQDLLSKLLASHPDPAGDLRHATRISTTYENLARLERRNGRAGAADSLAARRLELWQAWDRKLPNNTFIRGQVAAAEIR